MGACSGPATTQRLKPHGSMAWNESQCHHLSHPQHGGEPVKPRVCPSHTASWSQAALCAYWIAKQLLISRRGRTSDEKETRKRAGRQRVQEAKAGSTQSLALIGLDKVIWDLCGSPRPLRSRH